MNKLISVLLTSVVLLSCRSVKKIQLTKVECEDARKSVNLFYKTFPDKILRSNQPEIPIGDYHTVYGTFFPLIDSAITIKDFISNKDTTIVLHSDELKVHYPDLNFKKIEKEFKKLRNKNQNLVGCKIYNGFVEIRENNHPFEPENYLVFVELSKEKKGIGNRLYDDLDNVFRIDNHKFDLREFSQKRNNSELNIKNYHLSCAPNCPKPDLISEN